VYGRPDSPVPLGARLAEESEPGAVPVRQPSEGELSGWEHVSDLLDTSAGGTLEIELFCEVGEA
jgi:hypothetical protein